MEAILVNIVTSDVVQAKRMQAARLDVGRVGEPEPCIVQG